MTLLRDLINIPVSVGDTDFVVAAAEGADLDHYVVTEQLRDSFRNALQVVEHAVTTGQSQGKFLHGSFGSGKSHFIAVLREILQHNPVLRGYPARSGSVSELAEVIAQADTWLGGRNVLCLTMHMLNAESVEQAVFETYLKYVAAARPDVPPPAVHRSDALLENAAQHRVDLGDEKFFARLNGGVAAGPTGGGLAARVAQSEGWTPERYESAAAALPGSEERDLLVSALTATFFSGAVHSSEYLDLDTGLQVVTRHAKKYLGCDVLVLLLDELMLWLSTHLSDDTFVKTEGAKLNKLVESSDTARPLPVVSFIARQRNLEDFLGPQVGGTERETIAELMRSLQGRFGEIVLADTNLPEITEGRLLRPGTERVPAEQARQLIDAAFEAVRSNREVWDILLSGAQFSDAGVGSDRATFRRLYPFSPALVATLVALSQALQRERTALRVMTELLVGRRDTLEVNDLIGVAALFDPLVLHGELPDRPKLKQQFQAARDTYQRKLRPLLLMMNGITEAQSAIHEQFRLDDMLVRTLLLGALVPEVPALHNLTAERLHALNFGSIAAPVAGYESEFVVDRLTKLGNDAGELHKSDGPDPVFSLKLSSVDYDRLLDLVPHNETATGVLQGLIRDMVCRELALTSVEGTFGDLPHPRDWRGRRHHINVRFGNVRDRDSLPDSAIYADGGVWRIIVDYPFDTSGDRRSDLARIETLDRGSWTVFWLPFFFTDEQMARVAQLAKINYLLGSGGTGDRLSTLAADWSVSDRQQGKVYLKQRQEQLESALRDSLRQAYGVVKPRESDVEADDIPVLHSLAEGIQLSDPRGGTLQAAFGHLTGDLLQWSYPGRPCLPEEEKPPTKAELNKVLRYAELAAADPTHGVRVDDGDQRTVQRICNPLRLGELVDHRYVLTGTTCWWSTHLIQGAAKLGYTDHFPVHKLRPLLDEPESRGFDRDLQNLILAVFALEQQLSWYQHNGKFEIHSPQQVTDQLTLQHPPMPEQDVWDRAVRRARPLFGIPLPEFLLTATLEEFGSVVRGAASERASATELLVGELIRHSDVLGLEPEADTGRLATARRVAGLLRALAIEDDDVVLVGLVAEADVGEVTDITAAAAIEQAQHVIDALAATNWDLVGAIAMRADHDERAKVIIDELRLSAEYDQHAEDLAVALKRAEHRATTLITADRPTPSMHPEPSVRDQAGNHDKSGNTAEPSAEQPTIQRASMRREKVVVDAEGVSAVLAEIGNEISAGHRVRITWEVIE
ncbi:hypothetical protein [Nocardia sp. SC052]|uniref:hypothetical protein n=1 Tax=Nocardia sichangensis TaxID=3385975 RepID=UPI0039A0B4D6